MIFKFVRKSVKGQQRPNHKYIRRVPDGRGGWKYIYEEPKFKTKKSDDQPILKPKVYKDEKIQTLKEPIEETHSTPSAIEVHNLKEMKESDGFFAATKTHRQRLIKNAVVRLTGLVNVLNKNGIKNRETLKAFLEGKERDILAKYFGLTNHEFESESGDKFSNYISTSFSNDGHYVTFNYADKFFFDSINKEAADNRKPKWSMPLRISRGATFDIETGELVSLPYEKFFNMNEYIDGQLKGLAAKMGSQSSTATEKVDGILIHSFYDKHNDKIRFGTRKQLDGETDEKGFIDTAEKLVKKTGKYFDLKRQLQNNGQSMIFELVDPAFRVVVGYGKKSALSLHGVRDLKTMEIMPFDETKQLASQFGIESPETHEFNSFEELADFQKNFKGDTEGFVLRFADGSMIKAKTEAYFDRLKGLRSMNYSTIAESILDGVDWTAFKYEKIKSEELFDLADKYRDEIMTVSDSYHRAMSDLVSNYIKENSLTKLDVNAKEFMLERFGKIYNRLVNNGEINEEKVSLDDFRLAINYLASFKLKNDDISRDRYNKHLMKLTTKQLKTDAWMGGKLNEQEIQRSIMNMELIK